MKRLFSILAALAAFASPVVAEDCASGTYAYTHVSGTTCVPEKPQRIVTLHDLTLTLPLIELGLTDRIVGSMGRFYDGMAAPNLGSVTTMTGVDFDNSQITFVGMWEYDLEAIAALQPDLIIARPSETEVYDKLSVIAPTVIPDVQTPFIDYLGEIARLGGGADEFAVRKAGYDAKLSELHAAIENPADIDISILYAEPGYVAVYNDFYALSQVMGDLGIDQPEPIKALFADNSAAIDHATNAEISIEALQSVDADLLILPYWTGEDRDTPAKVRAQMEAVLPGWCDFFRACAEGQVVYMEATEVYSGSFASLDAALNMVEAHVAFRDLVDIVE